MLQSLSKSTPIHFSESFVKGDDNFHVFEVNEDILNTLLTKGSVLIKNVKKSDDAILATTSKTYKLQRRLYSNSFLFTSKEQGPNPGENDLVIHTIKDYLLEVTPQTPNWGIIYKYLENNKVYEDDQMNLSQCGTLFDDLVRKFPISEEELLGFLQKINVCEMNDRWFMVDEAYLLNIFNTILYEVRIAKEDLNEIKYPELLTKYGIQKDKYIVLNALQNYMDLCRKEDDQLVFSVNFEKVCKAIAKEMFLTKETYYWADFKEIFTRMQETYCPSILYENLMEEERVRIESSCFSSFAIIVDENNLAQQYYFEQKVYVKYMQAYRLPYDVKDRLTALFNVKKKYFYEEMIYWLKDLVKSIKEFDTVLMKNTRVVYDKLSRNNYNIFCSVFRPYVKNIVEDPNSKGQFYDVRYYTSKY